jgi:hypothetical protein
MKLALPPLPLFPRRLLSRSLMRFALLPSLVLLILILRFVVSTRVKRLGLVVLVLVLVRLMVRERRTMRSLVLLLRVLLLRRGLFRFVMLRGDL